MFLGARETMNLCGLGWEEVGAAAEAAESRPAGQSSRKWRGESSLRRNRPVPALLGTPSVLERPVRGEDPAGTQCASHRRNAGTVFPTGSRPLQPSSLAHPLCSEAGPETEVESKRLSGALLLPQPFPLPAPEV